MSVETPIHPEDILFDDDFHFSGETLSDLLLEQIRTQQGDAPESKQPIPVYALGSGLDIYVPRQGVAVTPETFHQAIAFDVSPQEIVDTANAHYDRLRKLGLKVVGHLFEPLEENDNWQTNPKYPTILTGYKYLTTYRESDVPEDVTLPIGGSLDGYHASGIVTTSEIQELILDPLKQYYEWCDDSDQDYVLGGLNSLHSYIYHKRQATVALQEVSSKMGKVSFPGEWTSVGNLWMAARGYENFYASIVGKSTEIKVKS